ncbi:MAG: bestrophin family ion channel [Fulvivirga sp.]|uniref:bestrophin family protein n=1 Tax=Fulvivirga sp. TaxID=1931237 RepID=UPI0032EEC118
MYVKRRYGFWMTFNWSKLPFFYGAIYGTIVCSISYFMDLQVALPWGPLGIIGIAVAFYLGFKNNSSYDRTWEARKIWGSIVNNSRTFGAAVVSFVKGENSSAIHKELIYRHIAWLTLLRHQLRLSREWEHTENRVNGLYAPTVCENYTNKLEAELSKFISSDEIKLLESKTNGATQILKIQSTRLQQLRDLEHFEDFRHMEFHQLITTFYEDQGKSERIKNFPFPRQYASVAIWITVVFCVFVPFGLLDVLGLKDPWTLWICPFLSGLITWVFFLMEKIGDYSENPFEGTYNDVPITSIARGIEIDLREMIDDENIPEAIKAENGFLM